MTKIQKIIGVVGIILVAGLLYTFSGRTAGGNLGGTVENYPVWFTSGIRVGSGAGSVITGTGSGFTLTGNNSITGNESVAGNMSITGTLGVTGATTLGTLTQGGGIGTVATTSTTYTLASTDFDTENVIDVTPGGASLTLTLPASSTLPLSTTAGAMRTVVIRNATTTAGINITMAAGTGETIRSASSTLIIQSDTSGAKGALLHFVRKSNSDILVFMTSYNN